MFRATLCSSSGGQLYEYNFWYNHSMLVTVRYASQDGVPSWLAYRTATNTEWLYQKLYSYNCPPEDEHRDARNMFVCFWHNIPQGAMTSSFTRFLDHTQRRTTVGRTPLDEWSARRRDLYLTTHNTHNRQISIPPVGLEPIISASERPQTYALDRAATGTGARNMLRIQINVE